MIHSFKPVAFVALFFSSCIQVPLGNPKHESYNKVHFQAPKNFKNINSSGSDQAWIKTTNGNIISYRSECPSQVRSIDHHFNTISNEFLNSEVESITKFPYNKRTATRFKFSGDIESITTSYDLVGFKKYGCFFIITHNGKKGLLKSTQADFERFLKGFKVVQ